MKKWSLSFKIYFIMAMATFACLLIGFVGLYQMSKIQGGLELITWTYNKNLDETYHLRMHYNEQVVQGKNLLIANTPAEIEKFYTLALVLAEVLQNTNITFEIFASDIDTKVLNVASNGVYHISRLEQIPKKYHGAFLARGTGDISSWFRLKKDVKSKVTFGQVNLVSNSFPFDKKFDLVLCRNVLIYFDARTIGKVSQSIFKYCEEDAMLIIGHSESLQNTETPWKYVQPSIYSKGKKF